MLLSLRKKQHLICYTIRLVFVICIVRSCKHIMIQCLYRRFCHKILCHIQLYYSGNNVKEKISLSRFLIQQVQYQDSRFLRVTCSTICGKEIFQLCRLSPECPRGSSLEHHSLLGVENFDFFNSQTRFKSFLEALLLASFTFRSLEF